MILRQELQQALVGRMDVLLLQENKLSASQTSKCGKVLPGRCHTYWEPWIREQGWSRGVCTSIDASLLQHLFRHGTLIPGRALWVGLDIKGSKIGVLNIYAPTDMRRRATFWSALADSVLEVESWIIGGDFNLETLEDQQGQGSEFASIARAEQTVGESFLFVTGGRDSWREPSFNRWPGSLDFSLG